MSRLTTLVPALGWLPAYDRRRFPQDLVGGITAGAVVVPQAMAYATIADLPVQVGLYTCMVPMVVYALLGGSRTLSVSTTSTVAILTASTLLGAGVAARGDDPARDLATLTLLVGVFLLVARVLRLGSLIDTISEATLTGVKVGVGLTVAAGQLPKLLGIEGDPSATSFFAEMRGVLDDLGDVHLATVLFSTATIAVLLVLARLAPKVPGQLVAVVAGIALVAWTSIEEHGVAPIADVPSGLPTPVLPSLDHLSLLVPGALAIAIMCFLETASVARAVRRPSEPEIDDNQELVANGVACVAGGVFRAMPAAGGFSQTAINQRAGAQTQLSELVTATLAVLCALFLGPVLEDLPQATLAALVVVAVLGLIEPAELRRFWRLSRVEFWVAVVTAAAGLYLDLLAAVFLGVALTLFLVLRELGHVGVTELRATLDGTDVRAGVDGTAPIPGLLLLRLDGPLYAANVRPVIRAVLHAVDEASPRTVVLDLSAVARLSVNVLDELEQLQRGLDGRRVRLELAAVPPVALALLRQMSHWSGLEAAGRVHATSLAAVTAHRG